MSATPGLSYSMSLSSTRPLESKPARTLCGAFRSGGLAIAMTRIPPHSLACTPHIAVLLPKGYILGHDKQPKRTQKRIHVIRGKKVMLDSDLASLYEVEVKQLNQAVKRNINRFPDDFMFRLPKDEFAEVIANCDHIQMKYKPTLPNVFTEQAAAMAACGGRQGCGSGLACFIFRVMPILGGNGKRKSSKRNAQGRVEKARRVCRCKGGWQFPFAWNVVGFTQKHVSDAVFRRSVMESNAGAVAPRH